MFISKIYKWLLIGLFLSLTVACTEEEEPQDPRRGPPRQTRRQAEEQARRKEELAEYERREEQLRQQRSTTTERKTFQETERETFWEKYLQQEQRRNAPRVVEKPRTPIYLRPDEIEILLNRFNQTKVGDWDKRAQLSTYLLNPWSGILGTDRAKAFADDQGLLRGPIFAENSVALKDLAKQYPVAAYELAKAANTLQAYFQSAPYLLKGEKIRAVVIGAAVLIRASAVSRDLRQMNIAKSLVGYFTGDHPTVRITVVEENRVVKFAPGNDFAQVIHSENASQKIAQAVYHELAQNLSWIGTEGNSELIQREWGLAYSVEASIQQFLRSSAQDSSSWIIQAKQNYRLSYVHDLSFHSLDVQEAFNEISGMRTSTSPLGEMARNSAFSALKVADDLFKAGDFVAGNKWLQHAKMMVDMALGFYPVTDENREIFLQLTGQNPVSGEPLDAK